MPFTNIMSQQHLNVLAFTKLGNFLHEVCAHMSQDTESTPSNNPFILKFEEVIERAKHYNGWFTREQVLFSCKQWATALSKENLENWLAAYDLSKNTRKKVAIIMAGNIPMVGFHDLLSVLITGNDAIIKLSSNDAFLIPTLMEYLISIDATFNERISFTKEKLTDFDAIIATGSNNTARYFEYYFKNKPNIIRKNRNSVAILEGTESSKQLAALGEDVFRYFGLGCRSVSKIFVPKDYNFDTLFKTLFSYKYLLENAKYANNYDYNKAVYLMSEFKILDNGFLILKEDTSYSSPIASLFYETYTSKEDLFKHLASEEHKIQCLVANEPNKNTIGFGATQQPTLMDYADGVDTIAFLLEA